MTTKPGYIVKSFFDIESYQRYLSEMDIEQTDIISVNTDVIERSIYITLTFISRQKGLS